MRGDYPNSARRVKGKRGVPRGAVRHSADKGDCLSLWERLSVRARQDERRPSPRPPGPLPKGQGEFLPLLREFLLRFGDSPGQIVLAAIEAWVRILLVQIVVLFEDRGSAVVAVGM